VALPTSNRPLKIGVFGAGAIGCYVGGRLAAGGADVAFVARERLKQELTQHGLMLRDLDGGTAVLPKERVAVATDAGALADCDIALCCVKSAQTAEAGAALNAVLPQGAIVVSLQNGVRNAETLRAKLPRRIVLGGIVGFNVVSKGAGEFMRATSGPIVIEAAPDPRVGALAERLIQCGFETNLTHDIAAMQWSKLIVNLANAVSALSGAPTRDIMLSAAFRRVLAAIMGEALGILAAAGVTLTKLGPLPTRLFPFLLRLPTPLFRAAAHAQLRVDPEARSSMYDDLARGRPTEVDYLNGEIVQLARKNGADAPLNRRIVELVHQAEAKGGGSPQLGADALWGALRQRRPLESLG
jgi:2-dehydropantoate 2-reductase